MKKIIRTLSLSLALSALLLTSCTKKEEPDNSLPVVTPTTLSGTYKISVAVVAKAVDSNNDGFFSQDLLIEGYNSCAFDNQIEITPTNFSFIKKGVTCNQNEQNEVFTYKLDTTANTIELYSNGALVETLKEVSIQTTNTLQYGRYDSVLKQTIYFKLTKI